MPVAEPPVVPSASRWTPQRLAITVVAVLAGGWLLSPMFTSTYIEAYMERLQTMAMLLPHGQVWLDDQAYPINTEFLYLTRVGMVQLIRGCIAIFGSGTIWGLRALNMVSIAALSYASLVFARRWTGTPLRHRDVSRRLPEPWWALVAALILTPGIVEPSFFFADNLPSAAFATLALALVTDKVSITRWLAIGALFAAAMLVRLDGLLVAPMILAVLWYACRDYRRIALAVGTGLVSACVVFFIDAKVTGISLFKAIQVGRVFSAVNAASTYSSGPKRTIIITLGFFGLVTLLCLLAGGWRNIRERPLRWSLVMALMPAVFYLVVLPKANEMRDFCLLGAPFVVLHGGTGLRVLAAYATAGRGARSWAARLALLVCAGVLMSPAYLLTKDGPRALLGRLWSPIFWRQWQGIRTDSLATLDGLVQSVAPGSRVLVLESLFEPDRTLHLKLLQAGYEIMPAATEGDCQSIEVYRKGATTITNLRTESPYGIIANGHLDNKIAALQVASSLGCLRGQTFDREYYLQWGNGLNFWPEQPSSFVDVPLRSSPVKVLHRANFSSLSVESIDAEQLSRLVSIAGVVQTMPEDGRMEPAPSYGEFRRQMQNRFWDPKQ